MTADDAGERVAAGGAGRHEARERALSLLYEADRKGVAAPAVLERLPVPPDTFAGQLVKGVSAHRDDLDALIGRYARNWTLERMPVLDRTILEIGVFELAHRPDTPTAVIIDEAVELAKAYSTDESGRFVNGVLSRIAEEIRPAAAGDGGGG